MKKPARFLLALWALVTISFLFFHNATSVSSVPVALTPAGYVTPSAVNFTWQADPNATTYHFLLSNYNTNQTVYEVFNYTGTSLTLPGTVVLTNGVPYKWMVQSQYSATDFSAWSNFWGFIVYDPAFIPTPQQPAAYITNLQPGFSWTGVSGAATYDFQLVNSSTQAVVQSATGLTSPSYALPSGTSLAYNVIYLWQVRAEDSNGMPGKWSDPLSFLVYDQLLVPTTIAPTAYVPTLNPTFQWSQITAAVNYELQVLTQDGTTVADVTVPTNSAQVTYQFALNTPYQWRVRVISTSETGMWSPWNSFQIYDAGFNPTLSGPSGDTLSLNPTFSWNAVNTAVAYEVEILSGSTPVYDGATSGTSLNFVNGFKLNNRTAYSWHVRAVNSLSQVSDWSPLMTLNAIDPAYVPTPSTPVAAMVPTVQPALSWNPVTPTIAYYTVDVTDSAGNAVFSKQVSDPTSVLRSPVALANYGNYKWKVHSIGLDGYAYPASQPVNFSVFVDISHTPPTGLTNTEQHDRTIALTWNPVVGADHYLVSFDRHEGDSKFDIKRDSKHDVQVTAASNSLNVSSSMVHEGHYWVTVIGVDCRGIKTPNSNAIRVHIDGSKRLAQK